MNKKKARQIIEGIRQGMQDLESILDQQLTIDQTNSTTVIDTYSKMRVRVPLEELAYAVEPSHDNALVLALAHENLADHSPYEKEKTYSYKRAFNLIDTFPKKFTDKQDLLQARLIYKYWVNGEYATQNDLKKARDLSKKSKIKINNLDHKDLYHLGLITGDYADEGTRLNYKQRMKLFDEAIGYLKLSIRMKQSNHDDYFYLAYYHERKAAHTQGSQEQSELKREALKYYTKSNNMMRDPETEEKIEQLQKEISDS